MISEFMGPKGGHTTFILLNRYKIKLPYNFPSLKKPGMMAHTFNSSTGEAMAEGPE